MPGHHVRPGGRVADRMFHDDAGPRLTNYDAQAPFTSQTGDDLLQLDVYLVERPAADRCINQDIWELADEQVLQDRKRLLEENGFRACVLGDALPDNLQSLVRSGTSCANPRRLRLHAGKPAQLVLGPAAPQLHFQLRQDGRTAEVDLEQAQCLLLVTPRPASDGRVILQFTPAVRHGEAAAMPRPVQDPSGTLRWDVQTDRPMETYRGLGWELTVAPNTYIAVGTLLDRDDTLGQGALLTAEGHRTQRAAGAASRAFPGRRRPGGRGRTVNRRLWRCKPGAISARAVEP